MSEIKPCPFCGCLAQVQLEGHGYHVRCNNNRTCGAIGPYDLLKHRAVAAWNKRHNGQSVGDFEPWMVEWLTNRNPHHIPDAPDGLFDESFHPGWSDTKANPERTDAYIAAAIAKLFEEARDEQATD